MHLESTVRLLVAKMSDQTLFAIIRFISLLLMEHKESCKHNKGFPIEKEIECNIFMYFIIIRYKIIATRRLPQ